MAGAGHGQGPATLRMQMTHRDSWKVGAASTGKAFLSGESRGGAFLSGTQVAQDWAAASFTRSARRHTCP